MKRLFLFLLCGALSFKGMAADGPVPSSVLVAFHHAFTDAQSVSTAYVDELVRISFLRDGRQQCAYYTADAELVVLSQQARVEDLPAVLRTELQGKLSAYVLADVYRFEQGGKTTWYVALDGQRRHVVLCSVKGGWKEFSVTGS